MWFSYCVEVEVVAPRLGEEENMFVGTGEPILHRARHMVWLEPNYVVAEYPAVVLEGDSDSAGDHEKLLRLKPTRFFFFIS